MPAPKTLILTSTYPADLSPPQSNNRRRRVRRFFVTGLHIASLLASFIAITLFSAAIPQWNANFFHTSGPNPGDWTDGMALGPLGLAFLYHTAVLVRQRTQRVWRDQRDKHTTSTRPHSYHRGPSLSRPSLFIHTAIPALVLLSLLPSLLLAGYGSLFRFWKPAVRTQSGILVCSMLNVFARECQPTLYVVGSLQMAGIAFGTVVWTCHFALLLVALRNIRRHNLVKQLQREKLSQYAAAGGSERWGSSHSHHSCSPSRSSRRSGRGSSSSSSSRTYTSREQRHTSWYQPAVQTHHHHHHRDGSRSSTGTGTGARVGLPHGLESTRQTRTEQQEVPIFLIQPPEETHAPEHEQEHQRRRDP